MSPILLRLWNLFSHCQNPSFAPSPTHLLSCIEFQKTTIRYNTSLKTLMAIVCSSEWLVFMLQSYTDPFWLLYSMRIAIEEFVSSPVLYLVAYNINVFSILFVCFSAISLYAVVEVDGVYTHFSTAVSFVSLPAWCFHLFFFLSSHTFT